MKGFKNNLVLFAYLIGSVRVDPCLMILCKTSFGALHAFHIIFFLQAQKVSDDLMQKISPQNRRALDLVVAKCYYYHARIYEFLNKLDVVRR